MSIIELKERTATHHLLNNTATDAIQSETAKELASATKETAVETLKSSEVRNVAAGATAGAMAGSMLPGIGTITGAGVGATVAAYKTLTQEK